MRVLHQVVSVPFSILFYLFFGLTLVVFHPLQWLSLKLGGAAGHRGMVNLMNLCLLRCLHILLASVEFKNEHAIPVNRSLIIVSNHQSMFDIPLISWYLRKFKPKFISKIELGKGIPSISFNLRNGGNALIDRKNPKQSIPALSRFGKFITENGFSAVIFPEGTRSRNGEPKKFATTGIKILEKNMPEAAILPITIHNSWKFLRFGNFPMGLGVKLSLEIHEALVPSNYKTIEEALEIVEKRIKSSIQF